MKFRMLSLALALSTGCTPPVPSELATNADRSAYLAESARLAEVKSGLNRRNRDSMNLRLLARREEIGGRSLTRSDVLGLFPSPPLEAFSGRSVLAPRRDGTGGWWFDEKNQTIEVNPLP